MIVLHANWTGGRLILWAESSKAWEQRVTGDGGGGPGSDGVPPRDDPRTHGFAADPQSIRALPAVQRAVITDEAVCVDRTMRIRWPVHGETEVPSPQLARMLSIDETDPAQCALGELLVPGVSVAPERVPAVLLAIDLAPEHDRRAVTIAPSLRYWIAVTRLVSELLADQRFVPAVSRDQDGGLAAHWRLWMHREQDMERIRHLCRLMPLSARCVVDRHTHHPWLILCDFLTVTTDVLVRSIMCRHSLAEAVSGWDAQTDPHVAWLSSLLDLEALIHSSDHDRSRELMKGVRGWTDRLVLDGRRTQAMRLLLVLEEPPDSSTLEEFNEPDDATRWPIRFYLQAVDDPTFIVDATRLWGLAHDVRTIAGRIIDDPQDLLLKELTRASQLFAPLESALDEPAPTHVELTTDQAYTLLRESRKLLEESGIAVKAPTWWDTPQTSLAVRLRIDSEEISQEDWFKPDTPGERPRFGLDALVRVSWRVALGEHLLTDDELRKLSSLNGPLVRVQGRWVELRSRDIQQVLEAASAGPGEVGESNDDQMPLRDALQLAYSDRLNAAGLPVLGMEASGWAAWLCGSGGENDLGKSASMPMLEQPECFRGELRPYQLSGLSWLAFLDRAGFGACLADDMGLGKTIQLIALLQWERQRAPGATLGPTLLIVPMSVVGNWVREIRRFAPELEVLVHHGVERLRGDTLIEQAAQHDVVVTTFALAYRDREDLMSIRWHRIGLDEAQNIKNPTAKQSEAVRAFVSPRRVALTGTPVENRLGELWSIMDFCNPRFLGSPAEFRRRFAIPVERYRDPGRTEALRGLIRPFVLRRVKSDPNVIADLPDKLEYKVYCNLAAEQARWYEHVVSQMLEESERYSGMKRRGMVLASLTRLKQICNHPANYLKHVADSDPAAGSAAASRSGKSARLIEMLDEVLAEGDAALVFTQYRTMGHLLSTMIRHDLDVEPIFLHGGTPAGKRQQMIDRFQERDGSVPIFILSLKAGGFGLNLTAANHVFHYDRWWNPAVERQATDRAFRIGQTRTVQVHKYICSGTLEERIDQMIESKIELAENVVGSGEQWLTDLSTDQLRRIVELRHDEIADEPEEEDPADDVLTVRASAGAGIGGGS